MFYSSMLFLFYFLYIFIKLDEFDSACEHHPFL